VEKKTRNQLDPGPVLALPHGAVLEDCGVDMRKKLGPATRITRPIRVDPGLMAFLKKAKRPKETMAQCVRRIVEEALAKP
jgi:hypothetical protein